MVFKLSMIINWMNQLKCSVCQVLFPFGQHLLSTWAFLTMCVKGASFSCHPILEIFWKQFSEQGNRDLLNINSGLQRVPFVELHVSLTVCISVLLKVIFSVKAVLQC